MKPTVKDLDRLQGGLGLVFESALRKNKGGRIVRALKLWLWFTFRSVKLKPVLLLHDSPSFIYALVEKLHSIAPSAEVITTAGGFLTVRHLVTSIILLCPFQLRRTLTLSVRTVKVLMVHYESLDIFHVMAVVLYPRLVKISTSVRRKYPPRPTVLYG